MNKKETIKELRTIYPYNLGRAAEYDYYKNIIKKFKWSDKELDNLIKLIRDSIYNRRYSIRKDSYNNTYIHNNKQTTTATQI